MPTNPKFSIAAVNASATAKTALLASGYFRIYTAPQPDTADTPVTTQTLLSEHRFATVPFADPVAGVATAATITVEDSALATGDAAWFRALSSDGTTGVWDGSVAVTSADALIDNIRIVSGIQVTITSLVLTENRG